MVQGILGKIWVRPDPYLSKFFSGLNLSDTWGTEWKSPSNKKYSIGKSGSVNNRDKSNITRVLGRVD